MLQAAADTATVGAGHVLLPGGPEEVLAFLRTSTGTGILARSQRAWNIGGFACLGGGDFGVGAADLRLIRVTISLTSWLSCAVASSVARSSANLSTFGHRRDLNLDHASTRSGRPTPAGANPRGIRTISSNAPARGYRTFVGTPALPLTQYQCLVKPSPNTTSFVLMLFGGCWFLRNSHWMPRSPNLSDIACSVKFAISTYLVAEYVW